MACDSDPVYEVEDEINPPVPPVEVHLTKDDAFMRFRYVQQDICAVVKEEPRDTPPPLVEVFPRVFSLDFLNKKYTFS